MNAQRESPALAAEEVNRKLVRKRDRRAKFLLVIGSTLVSLAIIEVALRIVGYSYPRFFAAEDRRGYALRPGLEGWFRKEGEAYVRINSDGLRDREHAKAKPASTLRVAVLGDSYPAAFAVPLENSFCAVLERKLRECAGLNGRDVEVINFGVPGYGTAQELITLRNNVWQYSPDVVLLTVTTNNDISDNVRALKKMDTVPYFIWRDGRLSEDDSFLHAKPFLIQQSRVYRLGVWFSDHLRVIQAVSDAARTYKIWSAERKQLAIRAPDPSPTVGESTNRQVAEPQGAELGVDNLVYREPNDVVWNDAWHVTEGLISTMRDEVQSKGAQFLVVTLSNDIQVWPQPKGRQAFLVRVGAKDIFYPDNRIREFCERERITVACLAPAMQRYAEETRVFLHGFDKNIGNGHWNVLGNRVAGELTAAELCKQLQNPD